MSGKIYIPLFLLFVSLIPLISSSVIGLDFGSEFIKASTIQPGKLFSIVEDTTTKRKTPSAISFCNNERIFEWDTIAKRPKCYTNTFWYLPKFLGKSPNDPHLAELSKAYFEDYKLIENDRGLINLGIKTFKFDEEDTVSEIRLEDALGMIFSHMKDHAEAQAERQLRDIVVTIPPWWGFKERYALQDACLIAGLNPLGFVHENTAAALYYALEREDNTTFNVIFYNIGSGGLKVSLIEYKLENSTEKYEKGKQYESFKVLAEAWDDTVSGQAIDNNLVRHLANVFDSQPARKGKKSVLQSPTAISKLYKESQKVKETLSANKFVNIYMEGLFESTDLKVQIDRPTFEDINKDLFTKLTPPIQRVLDRAGKTMADINEIEIIGGAVRVPKIQQLLGEFAGREVSAHLNGDESMALGAAFYAANLSSSFKTRTIYLNDGYNFDIRVELRDIETPAEGQAPLEKAATLFPYKTRYGSKKTLAFSHDRDFQATFFASVNGNDEDWILRFNVTGFDKITENAKYKDLGVPKVSLLFQLNALGFVELKKAEATLEETIMVEEKVNKTANKTKNATKSETPEGNAEPEGEKKEEAGTDEKKPEETDEAKTEDSTPKAEDGAKSDTEAEPEKKYKKKVLTHTIALVVSTILPGAGSLSSDEIEKGIALLDKFDDFEEAKRKLSESKNRLESFIYRCREVVEEAPFVECSKQEERDQLSSLTEQNGEWLNGDEAYTAKYKEFDQRYNEMAQIVERVVKRIDQKMKRTELIERSRNALTNFTEKATEINQTRPWIHENLTNPIFKQIDEARTWLEDLIEKQAALGDNDDPVLIDTNVIAKLDRIKEKIVSVRSTPKPKPPKAKNGTKPDIGGGFKFDGNTFDEEAFKEYMKQNGNKFNEDFAKSQEKKEGDEEGQQNAGGDEQPADENANKDQENVSDKNEDKTDEEPKKRNTGDL